MRRWIVSSLAILMAGYLAYPYVSLYRIDHALRVGDAATLDTLVEWPAIRQDIKDGLQQVVARQLPSPSEGAGAAIGSALGAMLGSAVIEGVVQGTVDAPSAVTFARNNPDLIDQAAKSVTWAFFSSPTDFRIDMSLPAHPEAGMITGALRLDGGAWRMAHIAIPPQVIEAAVKDKRIKLLQAR